MDGTDIDESELHKLVTGVRNGLKHYQSGKDMEFELQEEAEDVLDRAIDNYFQLIHDETELMEQFKKIING